MRLQERLPVGKRDCHLSACGYMLAHTASRGALGEHAYVPFLLCTSRMIQRARPKVQMPRLRACSVSLCHTILSRGTVLSECDRQTGSQERAKQVQKHLATYALQVAGEVACSVKKSYGSLKTYGLRPHPLLCKQFYWAGASWGSHKRHQVQTQSSPSVRSASSGPHLGKRTSPPLRWA